jgi:HK97 family phage prohead protease
MMALQGYAVRYDQVIPYCGVNTLVSRGAFDETINSGATVKLTLSHHDGDCVGSTEDNLQLYSDHPIGLAFRFRFPDTALGRQAAAMAKSNEHSEVSVGFRNARKMIRKYGGADVAVIIEARLYEISYLYGLRCAADRNASATYENIDNSSLREDCESGKLLSDFAAIGVRRAIQRVSKGF